MSERKITLPHNGDDMLFLKILTTLIGPEMMYEKSLIDLCCHVARLTRTLPIKRKKYVDVIHRDIGVADQEHFVQASVLDDHPVFDEKYDVSLCLDGIEHLHKEEGVRLLAKMKKISDKQILFTPLHAWMMEPHNPHPESHKSLWTPDDLPDWAHIVMPVYHPTLSIGAFFFWNCENIDADFERVKQTLSRMAEFKDHIQ